MPHPSATVRYSRSAAGAAGPAGLAGVAGVAEEVAKEPFVLEPSSRSGTRARDNQRNEANGYPEKKRQRYPRTPARSHWRQRLLTPPPPPSRWPGQERRTAAGPTWPFLRPLARLDRAWSETTARTRGPCRPPPPPTPVCRTEVAPTGPERRSLDRRQRPQGTRPSGPTDGGQPWRCVRACTQAPAVQASVPDVRARAANAVGECLTVVMA